MVRPWKPFSATTMPVRPVRRASLKAASFASAPELQKNTRASGSPNRAVSRSASRIAGSVAARLLVWPSVANCVDTASTRRGSAWPSALTAMPASRSTYSRPSTSHTRAPDPRTSMTGGVP